MMAGLLVTSIVSGQLISALGRYKPFPIVGHRADDASRMFLLSRLAVDDADLATRRSPWSSSASGSGW